MQRWQTLFWLGAVVLLIVVLIWPSSDTDTTLSRPTTEDRGTMGLAALAQWLQTADIPVHSQRQRLDQLPAELAEHPGHIAIVHLPSILIYTAEEIRHLLDWVSQGNTLWVSTGHLEGSPWIYSGSDPTRSLWRLTGLGLQHMEAQDEPEQDLAEKVAEIGRDASAAVEDALSTPGWLLLHGADVQAELYAPEPHPLTVGLPQLAAPWDGNLWQPAHTVQVPVDVAEIAEPEAENPDPEVDEDVTPSEQKVPIWQQDDNACAHVSDGSATRYLYGLEDCIEIRTPPLEAWRTLLTHRDQDQPALLEAPLGQGQILVLLHASLLDNDVIHRFENRRFVMAVVTQYLGADGWVVFDDAHQGLNDILEASDLISDWRLYASIGFLMLFWVTYLLADAGHWQRARYRASRLRVGQRQLVQAGANFLSHRLSRQSTYGLLLEPLREHLAHKWRLAPDVALSEGLALERSGHRSVVEPLEHLLGRIANGDKIAPLMLQDRITLVREAIT